MLRVAFTAPRDPKIGFGGPQKNPPILSQPWEPQARPEGTARRGQRVPTARLWRHQGRFGGPGRGQNAPRSSGGVSSPERGQRVARVSPSVPPSCRHLLQRRAPDPARGLGPDQSSDTSSVTFLSPRGRTPPPSPPVAAGDTPRPFSPSHNSPRKRHQGMLRLPPPRLFFSWVGGSLLPSPAPQTPPTLPAFWGPLSPSFSTPSRPAPLLRVALPGSVAVPPVLSGSPRCPHLVLRHFPVPVHPGPGQPRFPAVPPLLPRILPAHLPCLVMIISVWCLWNLAQSG